MNKSIEKLSKRLFENVSYSAKTEEARTKVFESLNEEYKKELKSLNPIQSDVLHIIFMNRETAK